MRAKNSWLFDLADDTRVKIEVQRSIIEETENLRTRLNSIGTNLSTAVSNTSLGIPADSQTYDN